MTNPFTAVFYGLLDGLAHIFGYFMAVQAFLLSHPYLIAAMAVVALALVMPMPKRSKKS